MLLYIFYALAVSAEAWHATLYLVMPWQYLACYSIIYSHALAVSAEALHATLYLVTPWQYLPRLGILFYILSCLGSICRGLACYSISYHALAVSAEAWHAFLSCHALAVGLAFWRPTAGCHSSQSPRPAVTRSSPPQSPLPSHSPLPVSLRWRAARLCSPQPASLIL